MANAITIHDIMAGAYKGKRTNLKAMLSHASADGGLTALCGKVKAGSLCDSWESEDKAPSCPHCARKMPAVVTAVWAGPGEFPVSRFMTEIK